MNLPCPFESSFPLQENNIFNSFIIYILENYISENDLEKDSTYHSASSQEESELESENEETVKSNLAPKKRSLPSKKILKKHKLLKPTVTVISKTVKTLVEDVFEKIDRDNPVKKIEVNIQFE